MGWGYMLSDLASFAPRLSLEALVGGTLGRVMPLLVIKLALALVGPGGPVHHHALTELRLAKDPLEIMLNHVESC